MANHKFEECIASCEACARACTYCATSCLQEENVTHLRKCIRLNLECAAICRAAVKLMTLESDFSAHLCRVCADACNACATECEQHAKMGMDHCRICAEACRLCAANCETMATPV
ncbi:four-helix bundle copper-binding protein [Dyadobacter sp. 50-39]|uniref:four-helix bundle copper-binding protein n=1 Tax=Dyadobacter sp. 50-39 TaxID=1895756 RepID=UPI00286DF951|nr:four-helix bundle copper-binding protein [Dyadobacter sp. 50-39]